MDLNDEIENAPLFYYSVVIALIISTIYGVIALFTGALEEGTFILTISALFYVAIYYRLFSSDSYPEEDL